MFDVIVILTFAQTIFVLKSELHPVAIITSRKFVYKFRCLIIKFKLVLLPDLQYQTCST